MTKLKASIQESLENLWKCLDKIQDETETWPGQTLRGTDASVIDVPEILKAIEVARSDLSDIEETLK